MIISVIGCGESAKEWVKTPCDLSIGVNDCWKFGHPTDYLVCVNSPKNFSNERFHTICNSKPNKFFTHNQTWKTHFPQGEVLALKPFTGRALKGRLYKSQTSPIIAISMAWAEGASDIILWGVDFKTHHVYKEGSKELKPELFRYNQLIDQIQAKGVRVWVGHEDTVFSKTLEVWTQ